LIFHTSLSFPTQKHVSTHTFIFINPQYNNNLIPPHSNQFLNTPDTSPGQLAQQNHAIDIIILQQLNICAHFGNLADIDHDEGVDFRILFFVEAAVCEGGGVRVGHVGWYVLIVKRLAQGSRWFRGDSMGVEGRPVVSQSSTTEAHKSSKACDRTSIFMTTHCFSHFLWSTYSNPAILLNKSKKLSESSLSRVGGGVYLNVHSYNPASRSLDIQI